MEDAVYIHLMPDNMCSVLYLTEYESTEHLGGELDCIFNQGTQFELWTDATKYADTLQEVVQASGGVKFI